MRVNVLGTIKYMISDLIALEELNLFRIAVVNLTIQRFPGFSLPTYEHSNHLIDETNRKIFRY